MFHTSHCHGTGLAELNLQSSNLDCCSHPTSITTPLPSKLAREAPGSSQWRRQAQLAGSFLLAALWGENDCLTQNHRDPWPAQVGHVCLPEATLETQSSADTRTLWSDLRVGRQCRLADIFSWHFFYQRRILRLEVVYFYTVCKAPREMKEIVINILVPVGNGKSGDLYPLGGKDLVWSFTFGRPLSLA